METAVYYCCVAKGGRIIQAYSGGDLEIENLAALCLKSAPPFHRWYAQSMGRRTYGFLMEDGFIYFAIADIGLGIPGLLQFLEHVRDEFKNITKRNRGLGLNLKGNSGNLSNQSTNLSFVGLQEQLVPVIRQLITSLQNVSQSGDDQGSVPLPSSSPYRCGSDGYGEFESATSTKAPLLGKSCKQEKKTMAAMRGIELEEHRRSADRGCKTDSDSNNQGVTVTVTVTPNPLQKEMSTSMRMRSASQTVRRKWCRLVRLVLVIDAAVCIVLLLVWLVICQGLQCIR